MKGILTIGAMLVWLFSITAQSNQSSEYLIKVSAGLKAQMLSSFSNSNMGTEDLYFNNWIKVQVPSAQVQDFNEMIKNKPEGVLHIQPNYKIFIPDVRTQLTEAEKQKAIDGLIANSQEDAKKDIYQDNPDFLTTPTNETGNDPLLQSQWGMIDNNVQEAWSITKGSRDMIVAVIDTGVDYTHEDLVENLWHNPGENGLDALGNDKATNGIDDDGNGYIDDLIGWDFVSNDNKPYDLPVPALDLLFGGGNPGHGTHCAGNVAARGDNGKGIAGVAPNVRIMSIRFISEKGQGTTADAIKAIRYAVDNGAQVLSNSWGSEGDDPNEATENEALKEAIRYTQQSGSLFIAAAGNGHNGAGYDNDTDSAPGYPASYDIDTIVSVAALDSDDALGAFSNWGKTTVDLGAPGVKVFSTMVGNIYSDKVIDFMGLEVFWDGTSMATPHVAGAAALYWSAHPEKDWSQVKAALIESATPISSMNNKSVSNGKLNVKALMGL